MGLDVHQFRQFAVKPALTFLGVAYSSPAAENLLVGTALMESNLVYLQQLGSGPARGVYQIEPATHEDLYAHWFPAHWDLKLRVESLLSAWPTRGEQLRTNLLYATAICRLIYFRNPMPLPTADDIDGLAAVWKAVYNTPLGAGDPAEWAARYRAHHPVPVA